MQRNALTFLESIDMWSRFAVRLAAPPIVLWIMLAVFQPAPGTSSLTRAVLTPTIIILIYWLLQNAHFRFADGSTLLRRLYRDLQADTNLQQFPTTLLLVGITLAAATAPSLLVAAATKQDELTVFLLVLTGIATYPIAYSLFTSNQLLQSHRTSYIARRDARIKARKEAEELRRKQALIVPPKPPVTFESRLNDITAEHQERMRQLARLQIDPQERDYLIELQQARYLEQVRTLTDPSLGRPSDADFPTDLQE